MLARYLWVVNVLARNNFVIVIGECLRATTSAVGGSGMGYGKPIGAPFAGRSACAVLFRLAHTVRLDILTLLADNHLNTDDTFITNPRQWNTVWFA